MSSSVVIPPRDLSTYVIDRTKMYSTNLQEIQAYIDGSIYSGMIDARVVYDTNVRVDTDPDFVAYVMQLPQEQRMMVLRYQNIFDINKKIEQILRKTTRNVSDTMSIGGFVSGNYDSYVFDRDGMVEQLINPAFNFTL